MISPAVRARPWRARNSRFARKALKRCCLKARRGVADRVELAEGGFRLLALIDVRLVVRLQERGRLLVRNKMLVIEPLQNGVVSRVECLYVRVH